MIVTSVHIEVNYYPSPMQGTPHGQEEVAKIKAFETAVHNAAKLLPDGKYRIKIREERVI